MQAISRFKHGWSIMVLVLILTGVILPSAHADAVGTVLTNPGDTVIPGLTSGPAGTLLASLTAPFVTSTGSDSGTIISAVFKEPGGTLDFYYQVMIGVTSTNCGMAGELACDALSRETDTSFIGFHTALGFRTDGASLPGGVFVNGSVAPVNGNRSPSGNVVGFNFFPGILSEIQPGQTSDVLVISTDATSFGPGNASVLDGGFSTVASFAPTGVPKAVPEPGTVLLLGAGLSGLFIRRLRK